MNFGILDFGKIPGNFGKNPKGQAQHQRPRPCHGNRCGDSNSATSTTRSTTRSPPDAWGLDPRCRRPPLRVAAWSYLRFSRAWVSMQALPSGGLTVGSLHSPATFPLLTQNMPEATLLDDLQLEGHDTRVLLNNSASLCAHGSVMRKGELGRKSHRRAKREVGGGGLHYAPGTPTTGLRERGNDTTKGAPAAAADRKQRPDATCEGKNG